ncbi:ankyrin repeat domain-containing protein [Paraburkholderia sp. C35]|uniref:ankyrin repeat domain-containing protein n=1 Tax=Paraburkholderia sp. C35 TaxID=2126993 RepID=UPI000D69A114|nr:ankyrin repeat domain-containing protein [Paraburkholderia sp. C35]
MTTLTFTSSTLNGDPLFMALVTGNFTEISRLLKAKTRTERRAFLAKTDYLGDTPLINASKNAGWAVVHDLLSYGADVNARNRAGRTALHYAIDRATDVNKDHAVRNLMACKADMTIADNNGITAGDLLAAKGYAALATLKAAA